MLGNDDRFTASVFHITPGAQTETSSVSDRATCLHVATGSGQLLLGTAEELRRPSPPALDAKAGDLVPGCPGCTLRGRNNGGRPLVVARHEIPPDVAFV